MTDQPLDSVQDEILTQIDALDMTPSLKAKMRLVHDHVNGTTLGMPKYDLKGTKVWSTFNIFAFLFSAVYYIVKGMWKKALILIAIVFVLDFIGGFIIGFAYTSSGLILPGIIGSIGTILVPIISMQSAYYDIYRSRVLKQDFWW